MKKILKVLLVIAAVSASVSAQAQPAKTTPNSRHVQRNSHFETLPTSEKDIIFLGDEHMDGWEWSEWFGDMRMKNRGIEGNRVWDVLQRLDPIVAGKPAKVFLLAGIYDLGTGDTSQNVAKYIGQIIDRFKKESPSTTLYVHGLMPVNDELGVSTGVRGRTEDVKRTNKLIRKVAKEKGVVYIDLFPVMAGSNGKLKPEYTDNGLWLVADGYKAWIDLIKKYVN